MDRNHIDNTAREHTDDIGFFPDVIHVMLQLAREASQKILCHYQSPGDVVRKEDGSPVTPADEAANRLILAGLNAAYPDIPVLAEESADPPGRQGARRLFVVDPLDGTKEYIARNDEFSVNIALLEADQPVAGVVRMPVSGRVFCAAKGMGAWTTEDGFTWHRMRVSGRTSQLVLALSRSHPSGKTEALMNHPRVARTVVAGSSLKGCLIACGEADVYYRYGRTMEWDTAAMQVVVEEAGGLMRQLNGSPMVYNKPVPDNPNGFVILNCLENWLEAE